jgi:hypothetical protein
VEVVMAKLQMEILEKFEASVVHKIKGSQARRGKVQRFDFYTVNWDLTTFDG